MTRSYSNMERATSINERFAENEMPKGMNDPSSPKSRKPWTSVMDWIRELWGRSVSTLSREGFSLMPITVQTSERRRAMRGPGRR